MISEKTDNDSESINNDTKLYPNFYQLVFELNNDNNIKHILTMQHLGTKEKIDFFKPGTVEEEGYTVDNDYIFANDETIKKKINEFIEKYKSDYTENNSVSSDTTDSSYGTLLSSLSSLISKGGNINMKKRYKKTSKRKYKKNKTHRRQ